MSRETHAAHHSVLTPQSTDDATAAGMAQAHAALAMSTSAIRLVAAEPGPSIDTAYAIGWNSVFYSVENAARLRRAMVDIKKAA